MAEQRRDRGGPKGLHLFVVGYLAGTLVFAALFLGTLAKERGWFAAYHHPVVIANGTAKTLWVSAASLVYPQNRHWAQEDFRFRADTRRLLPGEQAVFKVPDAVSSADDLVLIRAVDYGRTRLFGLSDEAIPEMAFKIVRAAELQAADGNQRPDVVILDEDLFPSADLAKRLPELYFKPESRVGSKDIGDP